MEHRLASSSAGATPPAAIDVDAEAEKNYPQGGLLQLREQVAGHIAKTLVWGFLILLGIPLVYLLIVFAVTPGNGAIDLPSVEDLIKTLAAVLSGIVASVVAYYFGTQQKGSG